MVDVTDVLGLKSRSTSEGRAAREAVQSQRRPACEFFRPKGRRRFVLVAPLAEASLAVPHAKHSPCRSLKPAGKIELILSDVDGVMTDGGIRLVDDGRQMIVFHIRDGMGVRLWHEAGKRFGIVTGRDLEAVRRRAAEH